MGACYRNSAKCCQPKPKEFSTLFTPNTTFVLRLLESDKSSNSQETLLTTPASVTDEAIKKSRKRKKPREKQTKKQAEMDKKLVKNRQLQPTATATTIGFMGEDTTEPTSANMNPRPTSAATTSTATATTPTATAATNGLMGEDTTEPTSANMNPRPTTVATTPTCNCNTATATTTATSGGLMEEDTTEEDEQDTNDDIIYLRDLGRKSTQVLIAKETEMDHSKELMDDSKPNEEMDNFKQQIDNSKEQLDESNEEEYNYLEAENIQVQDRTI